ncbi:MAG TPA: DUF4386 domain-containing protein [Candidatus Polarisedimenticolia bacterium]|nr:DUF4386 domain-containing protein [Candidatus Polarisedimenticolia bacterium]
MDPDVVPIQRYARIAGVLGFVSIVAGGFGEAYVPAALVVWRDAAATAANITASESLFRWGFAGYLVEALCDVGLTLLLYLLLRVVRKDLALLSVFFRLIGTAGFAMAQVFHFAALPIVRGDDSLRVFSPEQLNTLALLSLKVSVYGQSVFTMFYGVGTILVGYLMVRSGFLPRFIGILLALTGIGFVAKTFTWVLAPPYSSPLLLLPAAVAALALTAWLLVKGVDAAKWMERADSR